MTPLDDMKNPWQKYDPSQLCFRRQFILGPSFVEHLAHWQRLRIATRFCVTAHPDLGTCQATDDRSSVTLLGFILNPGDPAATDQDIVNGLLKKLRSNDNLDDFIESTYAFGGRWALIADNGREARLFHDAAGLRQVHYTLYSAGRPAWCASDPGVIASLLGLPVDSDADSFISSYGLANREYWWPGDTSPYSAVKRLLPNHYLNLDTFSCHRYWPTTDLPELSLSDCVDASAHILLKTMESARNRFPLALTVTAGWDSRVALAATRQIKSDVLYFTLMYWEMSGKTDDIRIPARLLPKLGLRHVVITCPPKMDDGFAAIYYANVTNAHEVYGGIAQGLLDSIPHNSVMVKAVVSEVGRSVYQRRVPEATNLNLTAEMVARAVEMEPKPFALSAFDGWLAGTNRSLNVELLDLLFVEQRMGSWQAMGQLEWDIVQDVFTPFNCRALMIQFLSVNSKYRDTNTPILHTELMRLLWPAVLTEPINPDKKRSSLTHSLRQFIADSPLRRFVPPGIKRLGRRFLYPARRFGSNQ
jgi:hypothetical protein